MKEKLVKFLASKWFGLIVGLVLTILAMWQEKSLGDMVNAWALGLIISVIVGALVEAFRLVIANKFIAVNIAYWALGSVIGIAIMYLV